MAVNLSIFNSNKVMRFVSKLTLFITLLAIIDFVGGSVIGYFYHQTKYGDNWPKVNWLLDENCEVVILGSSRTFRHYIPSIISKQIGYSVFNGGENGQYLLYAYALEQLVLEKNNPKLIILDLLPGYIIKMENPKQEYERLESLLPYADNRTVRELLVKGNRLNAIKLYSMLYRYNSKLLSIADNLRSTPENWDNGYVSIGRPRFRETNKFAVDLMAEIKTDREKVEILKRFVSTAHDRGVPVIFTFSPLVEPMSDTVLSIVASIQDLAAETNVPFIKFTPDLYPEYLDRAYFMDYIHMNEKGATRFSKQFANVLADTLKNRRLASGITYESPSLAKNDENDKKK